MQPAIPCPACTRWPWTWASGLLLCLRLWLGTYSVGVFVFCFPPGYVGLWDSETPHRPIGERVFCCLETSPPSRLPPQDRSLSLTLLSLFLSFGWLFGCLVSFVSVQKLFCGRYSAFKWSFDKYMGEKVVFPSYSSTILGLPPWMLSFKPGFSLSSFIKRLFSSSSLLPCGWHHLCIWGYWYFSWKSGLQLLLHPVQHFSWRTLHLS